MNAKSVFDAKDILGEGPVWSIEEQALYWVDIKRPALQRWNPATGEHTVWHMPADIGCFALRKSGGAVVALRSGLAWFDFDSGKVAPAHNPEANLPGTRFNDGKCDRQGRFWAGTMDEGEMKPQGALYRLGLDGGVRKMRGNVTVSNGLGWSPDNRTMYYTDSPTKKIFAYDFNPDAGSISNERIFTQVDVGFPDGLTVDAEGYVWSARWDGWKVVRYAPDGTVDCEIALPVQRPTSCMFGGKNMQHLFVPSASVGLSQTELAKQPQAGNLFVIEAGISGLPEPPFAG